MSSGTLAHPKWVRVGAGFLGSRFPGLWGCSRCSLPDVDPLAYGFAPLSSSTRLRLLPDLDLEADVSARRQIALWSSGGRELLGDAQFDTGHPQRWWEGVHREERLVLVLGSCPARTDDGKDLNARWVGTCPLQVHVWADGVGTTPAI